VGGIWVHGELAPDGSLAKLSTEVATLARSLAADSGGTDVTGIVIGTDPAAAAKELAKYVPTVWTVKEPLTGDNAAGMIVAERLAALVEAHDPDVILTGAGPEGRDLAGALSALTGRGVLANATAVRATPDGPVATHSVFGGKLITESALVDGRGIITVRPNSVTAEAAARPGKIEAADAKGSLEQPPVPIVDAALGGAVGATRAAVDSGWIPYSQQIGQTGKIVKPQLYLAMGISGAIQHKVGMQTASTIIAVNRDPDAPIADFADMIVIGDLVEVGNALLAQLRARSG
jgi:electron transfer flavoprotein alpha subunit